MTNRVDLGMQGRADRIQLSILPTSVARMIITCPRVAERCASSSVLSARLPLGFIRRGPCSRPPRCPFIQQEAGRGSPADRMARYVNSRLCTTKVVTYVRMSA